MAIAWDRTGLAYLQESPANVQQLQVLQRGRAGLSTKRVGRRLSIPTARSELRPPLLSELFVRHPGSPGGDTGWWPHHFQSPVSLMDR